MNIERPETITVQFRTDLLYAMMNVLDVAVDDGAVRAMVKAGSITEPTLAATIEGLNDLVTSVEESFGTDCWVDWGG